MSIIIITGPTASGKTAVAVRAAQLLDAEVVSADSMQIYKHMDIGTAKPTAEEIKGAIHHMVDVADPKESYSVACFQQQAAKAIDDILKRKKTVIICGGTGLYINSLICPMSFGQTQADTSFRLELNRLADQKGLGALYEMLKARDPEAASRIHTNDRKRIIRALEINRAGKSTESAQPLYKPYVVFVLNTDRTILYERINHRVDVMLQLGLADEVRSLLAMGCTADMQSMQAIGYKEICAAIEGRLTMEQAAELIKQNSRNYAKRQLTWFKRYYPDAVYIDAVKEGTETAAQLMCARLKGGKQ